MELVKEDSMERETISAISTALSDSGIGIIRISGEEAIPVANRIFCSPSGKQILTSVPSHTVHYGYITEVDKNTSNLMKESIIDEVMVTVLKAPKSFTTEDTVEISCHGGIVVLQKILNLTVEAGARIALPGEFTKRAFLNGRIDLSKAEAVMDIIHSQNEYALKSSVNQLTGHLSDKIKSLREQIIYEIAFIESAIDDPEHISLDGYPDKLSKIVASLKNEIETMILTAEDGRRMKEGIRTVILGKPNAGKSSLLNVLSGTSRAIVTDIEGTTRDVLEQTINLSGITLNVMDTAGIRSTEDKVEKIGVDLAKKYAGDSDLVLFVVDASRPIDENDKEILSLLKDKKMILLLNKTDLKTVVTEEDMIALLKDYAISLEESKIISTSMLMETGIDLLRKEIEEYFFTGKIQSSQEIIITNLRHKEALQDAFNSLSMVERSLAEDMPEDFYSIDLMSAYSSLGYIIGEELEDDLVETIFSKFCMGK